MKSIIKKVFLKTLPAHGGGSHNFHLSLYALSKQILNGAGGLEDTEIWNKTSIGINLSGMKDQGHM